MEDRDIAAALEKLELKPGSLLVLRTGKGKYVSADQLRRIADMLKKAGHTSVVALALEDGYSIETLDESAMRSAGWVRKES